MLKHTEIFQKQYSFTSIQSLQIVLKTCATKRQRYIKFFLGEGEQGWIYQN